MSQQVQSFELTFNLYYIDNNNGVEEHIPIFEDKTCKKRAYVQRVIAAHDLKAAQKIAAAMNGEEIELDRFLDIVLVEPTGKAPYPFSTTIFNNHGIWDRVLNQLGIPDYKATKIYSPNSKIIGLIFD